MPTNETGTVFVSTILVHYCCVSFLGLHLSNLYHLHLFCMFIPYMKISIELKQYETKTCYNLHVMSKKESMGINIVDTGSSSSCGFLQETETLAIEQAYENCLELDCNKAKMFAILINDKVHTLILPCIQFWWIFVHKRVSPESR